MPHAFWRKKMETWKKIDWIDGIPLIYEVSNYGNVRAIEHKTAYKGTDGFAVRKERIKKQQTDKNGYKRVMLYGKQPFKKFVRVHRLVAIAFIPNPNNLPCVNHKDENKTNNELDNLEWCTTSYNNTYGTRIERVRERTSKKVLKYDLDGNFLERYVSVTDAGRKNNVSPGNIVSVCKGYYKQIKGYIYRYE